MSRITFRDRGEEEHNFWQNYTDLMSGFLVVFIITSLVAWYGYISVTGQIGGDKGDFKVTIEQARMIRQFTEAQRQLNSKYFRYNPTYERFESKVDIMFSENDATIPSVNKNELLAAGRELEKIIAKFNSSVRISFKVIVEGRAARHLNFSTMEENKRADDNGWAYAETLSYNRARNLYNLWKEHRILTNLDQMNGEIFISGSGFGGQGRYPNVAGKEELNKTFIIQIIPYMK